VFVENLSGHKLPTAYPSRRAWLHFVVRDRNERKVFESGALNADGSIDGNDNDADPRVSNRTIARSQERSGTIYEPILGDASGRVTTGPSLGSRIPQGQSPAAHRLPEGDCRKRHCRGWRSRAGPQLYRLRKPGAVLRPGRDAQGPFHVEAELWYQPIGFRWAHNLGAYEAPEPGRFVHYSIPCPRARGCSGSGRSEKLRLYR